MGPVLTVKIAVYKQIVIFGDDEILVVMRVEFSIIVDNNKFHIGSMDVIGIFVRSTCNLHCTMSKCWIFAMNEVEFTSVAAVRLLDCVIR